MKRRGADVTAVDTARYAEVFAQCYVVLDGATADIAVIEAALLDLMARPGVDGYITQTFCQSSRFFQPHNGRRIDAMREAIEHDYRDSWMYPVLLTSLIEAADRVDSTTGVQMAYVKQWADRSYRDIALRVPELVEGPGAAVRADALDVASTLGSFDLAYLDPPYNQHRYFTNYHVWETLVAWDAPEHYGVACKRVDARDPATKSVFNERKGMPAALARCHPRRRRRARRRVVQQRVVGRDRRARGGVRGPGGAVAKLAFDSRRYVGAQIGIHNPAGKKVARCRISAMSSTWSASATERSSIASWKRSAGSRAARFQPK